MLEVDKIYIGDMGYVLSWLVVINIIVSGWENWGYIKGYTGYILKVMGYQGYIILWNGGCMNYIKVIFKSIYMV